MHVNHISRRHGNDRYGLAIFSCKVNAVDEKSDVLF
jgi:hypothetical protein